MFFACQCSEIIFLHTILHIVRVMSISFYFESLWDEAVTEPASFFSRCSETSNPCEVSRAVHGGGGCGLGDDEDDDLGSG